MKVGDRIEVVQMPHDPDPIEVGTRGTVEKITRVELGPRGERSFDQVWVNWDNGRTLMLCIPPDVIRVLPADILDDLFPEGG